MRYPYAVYVNGDFLKSCEDDEAAEQLVVDSLRAGRRQVQIRYLRRLLIEFTPADLRAVVPGKVETFLIRQIEAAVAKLGPAMAAPRGRRKQEVMRFLMEYFGVGEGTAMGALDGLRPYLK